MHKEKDVKDFANNRSSLEDEWIGPPPCPARYGHAAKLVVFDFDLTLTTHHVFKSLAGWRCAEDERLAVSPPHATTEVGQVMRMIELNNEGAFRRHGGFATASFGGRHRVRQVRRLLKSLKDGGATLLVASKGLVGAVRKVLYDLELLDFFSQVYGLVGAHYGCTQFDQECLARSPSPEVTRFLGPGCAVHMDSKSVLVQGLLERFGLRKAHAVLVDDDPKEITLAAPVCRTVWVNDAAGIRSHQIRALRAMVAGQGRCGYCWPSLCPLRHL